MLRTGFTTWIGFPDESVNENVYVPTFATRFPEPPALQLAGHIVIRAIADAAVLTPLTNMLDDPPRVAKLSLRSL